MCLSTLNTQWLIQNGAYEDVSTIVAVPKNLVSFAIVVRRLGKQRVGSPT